MGKFRLFDREKQQEAAAIRRITKELTSKFDEWVACDDIINGSSASITAKQASALEDGQIEVLLSDYDSLVLDKKRVESQWVWRRRKLHEALQWRKGALYRKCTKNASDFQDAVITSMNYCTQTYNDFAQGLDDLILAGTSTSTADLDIVFENIRNNCKQFVDATVPGGVHALEQRGHEDIALPDGILSYAEFFQILEKRKLEYKEKLQNQLPTTTQTHTATRCPANCICCSLRSTLDKVLQAQQNEPEEFARMWSGESCIASSS